jgi:WD40 repeat protein
MAARLTELKPLWTADAGDFVAALAWSPSGDRIAVAAGEAPVRVLDARDGRTLHELTGHGMGAMAVSFSADGALLATSGQDGNARIHDAATGALRATLDHGRAWVTRASFAPDRPVLATAAGKGVRLWSADGSLIVERPHEQVVEDIHWYRGGRLLATAVRGGLAIYDGDAATPSTGFRMQDAALCVVRWSPRGNAIAAGSQEGMLYAWNFMGEDDDVQAGPHATKLREMAWSGDGRYLVTGGGPKPALWDFGLKGLAEVGAVFFAGHTDRVTAIEFVRQGHRLATCGADGRVFLYDARKPPLPAAGWVADGPCTTLAWRPNDRMFAVGHEDGKVVLLPGG